MLRWVEGPVRNFFPYEKFLGAYGHSSGGRIEIRSILSSGHAPEFIAGLDTMFDPRLRGGFAWWVAERKPFMFDHAGALDIAGTTKLVTKRTLDDIGRFRLGAIAAHGVIDPLAKAGTYVSFSGVPGTQRKQTLAALNLIAPVFHALFLQTIQLEEPSIDLLALTDRQRQLVDLAMMGLSDKSIASRLGISESTVGNHFRAIYQKLGVSKRSQLIALLK